VPGLGPPPWRFKRRIQVSDKKTEVTKTKNPQVLYEKCRETAETCKIFLQMLIGVSIVILLGVKLFLKITQAHSASLLGVLATNPTLEIVGDALEVSAGIELAYMLFTPGPDEAIEPLIFGLAATALLVISDGNQTYRASLMVLVLVASVGFLFWVRDKFIPKE
jgi:hypothetical protein